MTDRHPAHKTNKLKDWLAGNKNRIEVFFLPPYIRTKPARIREPGCQNLTYTIGKKRRFLMHFFVQHIPLHLNIREWSYSQVQCVVLQAVDKCCSVFLITGNKGKISVNCSVFLIPGNKGKSSVVGF